MQSCAPAHTRSRAAGVVAGIFLVLGAPGLRAESAGWLPVRFEATSPKETLSVVEAIDLPRLTPADLPLLPPIYSQITAARSWAERDGLEEVESRLEYRQREVEQTLRDLMRKLDDAALRRLALGDGKRTFGGEFFYTAMCHRWIAKEVAKVTREKKRSFSFPEPPAPFPEGWQGIFSGGPEPAVFHRALGPYLALRADALKSPVGLSVGGERYGKLLQKFFADGGKGAARELLRFTWDSFCGTGSWEFHAQQDTAAFMSLLRDRRIEEALGMSFFVPNEPEWMREPERPFAEWRIDLVKYCGFDWENLLIAGEQVDVLAAHGSEKGARHGLLALRTLERPDPWDLAKLAAFLRPGDPARGDELDPRCKLSAEVQQEIIAFLDQSIGEDVPFRELKRRLQILAKLLRPETKATLHRLLKHPSSTYAAKAAEILQSFGEETLHVTPQLPVRFRIFRNNGDPWGAVALGCGVIGGKQYEYLATPPADADGFMEIARDEFLDPAKRGPKLVFSKFPASPNPLQRASEQTYGEPWIEREIARPERFDEAIKVQIPPCPLTAEISYFNPPPTARLVPTYIELTRPARKTNYVNGFQLNFGEQGEPPQRLTFANLSPGTYQLSVLAPGSAKTLTPPFEVAPGMAPLEVKLEKGSHVYASLVVPANSRGSREIRLLLNGEDVTEQYRDPNYKQPALFAGVPKGRFQVRVLSTAEFKEKHGIKEWEAPRRSGYHDPDPREGVDCEATTMEFVIDDTTPALLDLGRIEVRPTAAMQGKAAGERLISSGPPPSLEAPK